MSTRSPLAPGTGGRPLSRRAVLLGAGAVAAGAVAGTVRRRPAGAAAAAPALPARIVNRTGRFADRDLRIAVVGTDLASGAQAYASPGGAATPVATLPGGPADLSLPPGPDGVVLLPRPMSGRVYVSVGEPLPFEVVTDGAGRPALRHPAGWVPSDPAHGILHDWVEFTLDGAGIHCNTTMVDQFAIPFALELTGTATRSAGRLRPGGRDAVFAALAAQPGFEGLVLPGGLRVIAPGHGLDAGLFDPGYLDGEIDRAWSPGQPDRTFRLGDRTVRVTADGTALRSDSGVSLARPSTRDVLFCDGSLAAPNDGVTGPLAAAVGAALNRSVLHLPEQPAADPATYYRSPVTNHYARVMHEQTEDGRAYGFAFDDVADHAPLLHDPAPAALTITLTPF